MKGLANDPRGFIGVEVERVLEEEQMNLDRIEERFLVVLALLVFLFLSSVSFRWSIHNYRKGFNEFSRPWFGEEACWAVEMEENSEE